MAKKQKSKFNSKNVKINEEELSITKIGEIDTANQSSAFILILFGCILVFTFFLPTITNLIKGENKQKVTYTETKDNPTGDTQEQENENTNDPVMYTLSSTLSISLEENIQLDNFSLNENMLSYQVTNNGQSRFDFDKENYYLELYSEDDTLLTRILLDTEVARTSNTMVTIPLNNSASNMKKLLFVKKEESDYPTVVLQKNTLEEDILICSSTIETLTYKFKDDKVYEIQDNVNVNNTNSDYTTLLNEWKTKSETLNAINGVTSLFVNADTSFAVNTNVNLQTAKVSKEDSKYYYEKDTLAKVVNFEMEARGFSCN